MDRPICFFSDYGYTDDFAGVCRAVIARLAPEVRVIDVTHGLPERDVLAGAVVLRNTLPYMPDKAVILAVVDPGVGGPRRPVALRSHGDHLFVGPDNGLLMHAADADGGVSDAYLLSNQDLWLVPLSATFHGRDIFAPVAARLAAGLKLASVGTPVSPDGARPHRPAGAAPAPRRAHRHRGARGPLRQRGAQPARPGPREGAASPTRSSCSPAASATSRGWRAPSRPCAPATSSSSSTATARRRWPSTTARPPRSSASTPATRSACGVSADPVRGSPGVRPGRSRRPCCAARPDSL